jgi:hypothetical protein
MCVLEPDPKAGDCLGNELLLYCMTRVHATNQVIVCSLIYNKNLVCGEGVRLDCCDVISATSEPGMAIITLDRLCVVLSAHSY